MSPCKCPDFSSSQRSPRPTHPPPPCCPFHLIPFLASSRRILTGRSISHAESKTAPLWWSLVFLMAPKWEGIGKPFRHGVLLSLVTACISNHLPAEHVPFFSFSCCSAGRDFWQWKWYRHGYGKLLQNADVNFIRMHVSREGEISALVWGYSNRLLCLSSSEGFVYASPSLPSPLIMQLGERVSLMQMQCSKQEGERASSQQQL